MHFTLCTSLYAILSMQFTLCNSLYAIHSMHFTLCTSLYALHSMHFTLCTSLYALDSMHFTLCTSLYALHSMHFTLCTSLYALHSMLHSMLFTLCTSLYVLHSMLLGQRAPHGRTLRDAFGNTTTEKRCLVGNRCTYDFIQIFNKIIHGAAALLWEAVFCLLAISRLLRGESGESSARRRARKRV